MPQHPSEGDTAPPRTVSRRTVAKGAVWSVPVIAAASVIAPSAAAASSDDLAVTGICTSGAVTDANGNRRRFRVSATKSIPSGSTFTLTSNGALGTTTGPLVVANNTSMASVSITGPTTVAGLVTYTVTTAGVVAAGTSFEVLVYLTANTTRTLRMAFTGTDSTPLNNASTFSLTWDGSSQTCSVVTAA